MKTFRLTQEQKQFAEENYGLLCKFANDRGLTEDELGEITERYLKTVQRYLSDDVLRKYRFSTVLFFNLRSELSHLFRRKDNMKKSLEFDAHDCCGQIEFFTNRMNLKMTKKQGQALKMRLAGLTNREISIVLGISIKAVESRFKRLRQNCRH